MPRAPAMPVLICFMAMTAGSAVAEDAPAAITTDSQAYCLQLHDRVEQLRLAATVPPPREVMDLSAEGQLMCDKGLARGGVMRLRRALTIMLHPD
jgi:hypothetical protein